MNNRKVGVSLCRVHTKLAKAFGPRDEPTIDLAPVRAAMSARAMSCASHTKAQQLTSVKIRFLRREIFISLIEINKNDFSRE